MKVRFLESCQTAEGSFACRQVADIASDVAAGFIAAGLAVREPGDVEEATAPEASERAVSPKRRK